MTKSCDTCLYFVRVKSFVNGIGICELEDGRLDKVVKNCKDYKGKKYKRRNK